MIISRTPFRVSFLGGGTDYPGWYREHGGAVLSTTIDKYCYISVRELPPFFEHRFRLVYSFIENVNEISEIAHPSARGVFQHLEVNRGLEVHHDGDLPARSGVGSSSAFTVGLIAAIRALNGTQVSKEALAQEAIHVEHCVIREPVGIQDQISASFGGFNHITFRRDGIFDVAPVIMPRSRLDELQSHLMLLFTGLSRTAAVVAQTQIDNLPNRQTELHALSALVDQAVGILTSSADLSEFGRLLGEGWSLKRRLSDRVSNSMIDGVYETALRAGALGGKLLGAGGGGFMLLFVRPEEKPKIRAALPALLEVPFRFDTSGSRIVLYQPDGWQ
jgi:D-glycero-alpha-D-manno-heptose-7-phosphate kinase